MGRLFGTDGVRGVANTELTCELAMNLGRAAAVVLTEETHHRPQIIIGKDTRISSDMLEAAMVAGICSVGADALQLGVVPTPAVAFLVRKLGADAGVMISASHNPMEYNGIKIFSGSGYKLSDELEDRIEAIVLGQEALPAPKSGSALGRVIRPKAAVDDYVAHLRSTVDCRFDGLRVAVDCANGSASLTAPRLLEDLGGEFEIVSAHPDGLNINADCGSTHLEALCKTVREGGFDLGIAFDGDADRCLAVDETGAVVDGDKLIAVFAASLKKHEKLRGDAAVVTVMSNFGFFRFAEKFGIRVLTTRVGDRYVLEEMVNNGYVIGGEQSGHIIFLEHATTGDGELTALQLLAVMKRSGKKLSELAAVMESYPQVNLSVQTGAADREALLRSASVTETMERAKGALADDGRVVVRASGTEPLIRVMVEGKNEPMIQALGREIAGAVEAEMSRAAETAAG